MNLFIEGVVRFLPHAYLTLALVCHTWHNQLLACGYPKVTNLRNLVCAANDASFVRWAVADRPPPPVLTDTDARGFLKRWPHEMLAVAFSAGLLTRDAQIDLSESSNTALLQLMIDHSQTLSAHYVASALVDAGMHADLIRAIDNRCIPAKIVFDAAVWDGFADHNPEVAMTVLRSGRLQLWHIFDTDEWWEEWRQCDDDTMEILKEIVNVFGLVSVLEYLYSARLYREFKMIHSRFSHTLTQRDIQHLVQVAHFEDWMTDEVLSALRGASRNSYLQFQ